MSISTGVEPKPKREAMVVGCREGKGRKDESMMINSHGKIKVDDIILGGSNKTNQGADCAWSPLFARVYRGKAVSEAPPSTSDNDSSYASD